MVIAKTKSLIDQEQLRQKLKLKSIQEGLDFQEKHKKAYKALKKKGIDPKNLRKHSAKVVGASAVAGALILSQPDTDKVLPPPESSLAKVNEAHSTLPAQTPKSVLLGALNDILPEQTRPLTRDEEKSLEQIIQKTTGIKAKATLEGEHLNQTYGRIGAEQHLRRYPGDVNQNHAPGPTEYGGDRPDEILREGMAPGLGAWGYFAPSKEELTDELIETEKWYAVAQTLYLPDWNTRQPYLKEWYKYRKVMIINTENGRAVIASIADSGPAAWTGKHYGGSPEVMDYLGGPRYKKGPVIFFFVDDPGNRVPLGPVEYNTISLPGMRL